MHPSDRKLLVGSLMGVSYIICYISGVVLGAVTDGVEGSLMAMLLLSGFTFVVCAVLFPFWADDE